MHVNQEYQMEPLHIRSRQWDYDVEFAKDLQDLSGLDSVLTDETFIVCDEQVAQLHSGALKGLIESRPTLLMPATEETKSLRGVETLIDWLIANRAVRSSRILAIGGGCIQDLVSFTAHLYYRGIDWIFMPTTVLSQSDSCIGAKSGINVLPFKNQLGVLHSPRKILIVEEFLKTLPAVEIASGYGEVVKLSVTSSHQFFDRLESILNAEGIYNRHLLELTHASLRAKQEVIEEDEYEEDLRRILNYGHSFGHALEAISAHTIPHGLAVLWGLDIINSLGVRWGITDVAIAGRISALIRGNFDYQLTFKPNSEELLEMLKRDKKVADGRITFAVLRDCGHIELIPKEIDVDLNEMVTEYLESDYVFRRP